MRTLGTPTVLARGMTLADLANAYGAYKDRGLFIVFRHAGNRMDLVFFCVWCAGPVWRAGLFHDPVLVPEADLAGLRCCCCRETLNEA